MLEKYKENQKFFYNYFMTSFDKKRISHAYLIETNDVVYGYDLALDLAKFLLCDGIYDDKICDMVDNDNCHNLKIIGVNSDVKKGDILSLKRDFSMSSVDSRRFVYIIRDVQFMNKSASNSLLKFLEEPDGDVVAILVCDNAKKVLPTISSRCQIVSLVNDDNNYKSIFDSLYDKYDGELGFDDFVLEKFNIFLDIYFRFEECGVDVLASSLNEIKDCLREFFLFGFYLYFDCLNIMLGRDCKFFPEGDYFEKIMLKNDTCDIIRKIDVIDSFIFNLRYNVNVNLYVDNFFVCLGGEL